MELNNKRILVTGGYGFLGNHICQKLQSIGCKEHTNIKSEGSGFYRFRSDEYNLINGNSVLQLYLGYKPDIVIHAAAKVGGIGANKKYPADYFYNNLIMGVNLIHYSLYYKIEKFVFIGTICSYPKFTPVPFKESDLWNGYPEETNAPYGIAKKALLTQAEAYYQQYGFNYIYLMPVNLYGIGDNFDDNTSHVIPALIKKFLSAKKENKASVEVWGTGDATREFLFAEDAASAIVTATHVYDEKLPMNIGYGTEISIKALALMIKDIINFEGEVIFNSNYPDGQPRRCLDTTLSKQKLGTYAVTDLPHGLRKTIAWYSSKI